jgi:hypothetical protein
LKILFIQILLILSILALSNSSFLLNISPPKLHCLRHVKREACLTGKFRLLMLVKLKRDCCWLGRDCLFRSLKYPNCSTPWKVSHWRNVSVVRPPQPTPLVNCVVCTQAAHIFWGPWKQSWAEAQRQAFWMHLYPFTYIYIYHKHTVLHLFSNLLPGYSKKHIYQSRFKLPNFGDIVKVDTSCLHI